MPNLPVRELILQSVAERLALVAASETYHSTIGRVSRVLLNPAQASEVSPTVMISAPSDEVLNAQDGASSSSGLTTARMNLEVSMFWLEDEASNTTANNMVHDLIRCVCSDRSQGSNAINTEYLGLDISTNEAITPYATVTVRFAVTYRHEFSNPAQRR